MNVNYIAEINSFERWLETNYLPVSAQLLWYKLMMLNNRCGWSEWITVDNRRVMAMMQMSREATFIEVRNKLIEAGLIEFKKGKKGSPNQYHINTFNNVVQTEVQSVVQTEVKTVVNTVDINKHKQNKNSCSAYNAQRKNRFNNFHQRDTDIDSLESKLISNGGEKTE